MRPSALEKPIFLEFLVAFSIVLIVRGSAIFGVVWSQDDFLHLYDPYGQGFIDAQVSMLRPSGALVTLITNLLGATHPTNGALWASLHAGSMVLFGLALRKLWIPGSPPIYGIICALIFALYPAQNNLFTYQIAHPIMAANYCLAAYALMFYDKGGWRTVVSIAALAFALGYQVLFSLIVIAALIMLAIRVCWCLTGTGRRVRSAETVFVPVAALFACLAAAVIVYFFSSKLILVLYGAAESSRASFAGLDAFPEKVSQVYAHLKRLAYGNGEPSHPVSVKLLQMLLAGSVLAASFWATFRSSSHWGRIVAYFLLISLILTTAATSILLPGILLAYTPANPRNLMGASVFWSGIFCMPYALRLSSRIWTRIGLVLGVILALSYSIITNSVSSDIVRLNQRELLVASRMVERLSLLPGFDRLRTVALVGWKPGSSTDFRGSDQIWSSLYSPMATGVLREASGEDFANPSPSDRETAQMASRGMPIWPESGSVKIVDDIGIVVVGPSTQ